MAAMPYTLRVRASDLKVTIKVKMPFAFKPRIIIAAWIFRVGTWFIPADCKVIWESDE